MIRKAGGCCRRARSQLRYMPSFVLTRNIRIAVKGFSMYGKVKRQVGLRSRKHSAESSLHLTIIYHWIDELKPDDLPREAEVANAA